MNCTLLIGFKGRNNLSGELVKALGRDYCLLTNSFGGVKKDIDAIDAAYDSVILFGVDKNLAGTVRIERTAEKDGIRCSSRLDLERMTDGFREAGLEAKVSETPTAYLCNEAYWHLLRKFSGRAVLIHIPTMKNADEFFVVKVQRALGF
ncbi:hypothetical protein [Aristaeella hokkaidonensis]|uniref:Uncharacterized protein n=1 Tax=Aristaeella hokkaidonensis TaxID=3046382 RepID=A0AC61NJA1_9FIRM|nr:hypothetical protein [Aristaeella hokkaidonensis]QUC65918.1 hypothetical protein JYE49_08490 [Aristaeella hokkaidonensis]SNT93866.1 Pyroglutamyl peptidase [Aristaeella hokkaidonensis]